MSLKFRGAWRFNPPADGRYVNSAVPEDAIHEIIEVVLKVATQGNRQRILEHFKGKFCAASGAAHVWSSNASWAESDLWTYAREAAKNAPLFIEAFYDACESFVSDDPDKFAPSVDMINGLLVKHNIGYEIRPPRLEAREDVAPMVVVAKPSTPTLAEKAIELLNESLKRSEDLLAQHRGREAIQEVLWLLETVATAFRGLDTGVEKVEGRYFNQIVKELRRAKPGTTLDQILGWLSALHGYLSSPSGGGIRHGLDLNEGVLTSENEARLFCNLIRSYLSFLLIEYEQLTRRT